MSTPLLSWHNDPALKAATVAKMKKHREQDELIQGVYQESDSDVPSGYRGCALGCMLPYLDPLPSQPGAGWSYAQCVEEAFGIPQLVAAIIDRIFESFHDFDGAARFAVESIEAIPVGVDLTGFMKAYFCEHGGWPYSCCVEGGRDLEVLLEGRYFQTMKKVTGPACT